MKKRLIWISGTVVLVAGLAYFTLPLMEQRCSRWYHAVDFVSDKKAGARYGTDWSGLEKRYGQERMLEIRDETWHAAIEDIGAKPFYCN